MSEAAQREVVCPECVRTFPECTRGVAWSVQMCPRCGAQFYPPLTSDGYRETGVSFCTVRDARIIREIVRALDEARLKHPPFPSLASAVVEIQRRVRTMGERLCEGCGTMTAEVRRKLIQTAAMCLRALAENGKCA